MTKSKYPSADDASPSTGVASPNDEVIFAVPRSFLIQLPATMFAAALFAAFGVYIYATQAPRNDQIARWKVEETSNFTDSLRQDLTNQRSALRAVQSILESAAKNDADPLNRALPLIAEATSRVDRAASAIDEFRREVLDYSPRHFSLSDTIVTTAQAKTYKSDPPHDRTALIDKLNPFLWALMILPLFIGIPGTACITSPKADVRGFGMCMLTAIFGYYAGLGASLFALAAG